MSRLNTSFRKSSSGPPPIRGRRDVEQWAVAWSPVSPESWHDDLDINLWDYDPWSGEPLRDVDPDDHWRDL